MKKKESQFLIVLIPSHQPIRLDMAFPNTFEIAFQLMRLILKGEAARRFKLLDGIKDKQKIKTSLLAANKVFIETVGSAYLIHCANSLQESD